MYIAYQQHYVHQPCLSYALYLMSVMSQTYSIIIDRGISAHEHGKDMVDGRNAVDKRYTYHLMSKVQLTESVSFD